MSGTHLLACGPCVWNNIALPNSLVRQPDGLPQFMQFEVVDFYVSFRAPNYVRFSCPSIGLISFHALTGLRPDQPGRCRHSPASRLNGYRSVRSRGFQFVRGPVQLM